jgi:hypothetical protein
MAPALSGGPFSLTYRRRTAIYDGSQQGFPMEKAQPRNWTTVPASKRLEDNLMVEFSPKVLDSFAALDSAIGTSRHFDEDIRENLREYAQGAPRLVPNAITGIAFITREAAKHVEATQDIDAKNALSDLLHNLDEEHAIRIVKAVSKAR